ncbi:MAG TPA: hypothetical protein VE568_00210 [Rubrobacter sp.]|nr:hypothetical protein [Rubrobacter sp.]
MAAIPRSPPDGNPDDTSWMRVRHPSLSTRNAVIVFGFELRT